MMISRRRAGNDVRVSFSALIRLRDEDRHVLFHTPNRPGSFNPPGGVYKYFVPAVPVLDDLGFRPDRAVSLAEVMRADLRGFLPASSVGAFLRWFSIGAYREAPIECLHRELAEELAECGLHELLPVASEIAFTHVRSVVERSVVNGPAPDRPYRQLRHFEVYEPVMTGPAAVRLRRALIEAGENDTVSTVICATSEQIRHGRSGTALLGGHCGYLIGDRRYQPDLPMVR